MFNILLYSYGVYFIKKFEISQLIVENVIKVLRLFKNNDILIPDSNWKDGSIIMNKIMKIAGAIFLMFSLIAAHSGILSAATHQFDGGKITLELPDGWKIDTAECELSAEAVYEEGTMTMAFLALKPEELIASLDAAQKEIEKEVGELKLEKTSEVTISGMKAFRKRYVTAGESVAVTVTAAITPHNRFLVYYHFAPEAVSKKHESDIKKVEDGIRSK